MKSLKGFILGLGMVVLISQSCFSQFLDIGGLLPSIYVSKAIWGDYDNDQDLDILAMGYTGSQYVTKILRNDGLDVFTDINANLLGLSDGNAEWGDINNDGMLDIMLAGYRYESGSGSYHVIIYLNDGNSMFTEFQTNLPAYTAVNADWADYDNDGDIDVLLTGNTGMNIGISKIFRNDGNGVFTDINAPLIEVYYSNSDWGDYDSDGDLDLILCGAQFYSGCHHGLTKIYRNDGNDFFSNGGSELTGVYSGSSTWGDYNNDGTLDVLISGGSTSNNPTNCITTVYSNNQDGYFTAVATLDPVYYCSSSWGDFDNDGDSDIILTGASPEIESITKVYINEGNGSFTESTIPIAGVSSGSVSWGDYNNDGKLDILLTGDNYLDPWNHYYITKIYRNAGLVPNNAPLAPSNTHASLDGAHVEFSWDPGSDTQTTASGLTYNIKLGTSSDEIDIISPQSDTDGFRMIANRGSVNSNCTTYIPLSIMNDSDTYFWSCQSIDTALCGSLFSVENKFRLLQSIDLLTDNPLDFGQIPIGGISDTLQVRIQNYGLQNLIISNTCLGDTQSPFQFNYPNLGSLIYSGDIDTIYVCYTPMSVGAESDTLYIYSNAANIPVLKIQLNGSGAYVPPSPPGNVTITMNGYDDIITWDAVTQTIYGTPITPDYYLIFYNGLPDPEAPYYYHGLSTTLQYTHYQVGLHAQYMFYHVIAYKYYGRGEPDLSGLRPGMPEADIVKMFESLNQNLSH